MGLTFTSPARSERATAILGVALGLLFGICLLTGLLSHLIQQPPGWFDWPSRPVWLYRWTQGLHVFCGIAAIPVLLAKLWSVYPHLWRWPPVRGVAHAIERVWIVPLLGGALLLLVTGLMNIGYWYGWGFDFIRTHYWTAWIVAGALIVHLSAKLPVLRRTLARQRAAADVAGDLERRRFLVTTGVAAGVLLVVTVGSAFTPLRRLAVLSPRRQGRRPPGPAGQQGRPLGRRRRQAERPGLAASRRRPGRPPGHPDPGRPPGPYGRTHGARRPAADRVRRGLEPGGPLARGTPAGPARRGRRPGGCGRSGPVSPARRLLQRPAQPCPRPRPRHPAGTGAQRHPPAPRPWLPGHG